MGNYLKNKDLFMQTEILKTLFQRDLNKLKTEIKTYQKEENIWKVTENITNCGGNLCLHLIGNLNHFIGTLIGETGYVRQRALEFSQKDVPREKLIKMVEDTAVMIDTVLSNLTEADLLKVYPISVFKEDIYPEKMTTGFFLVHLTTHLTYHLGQINYHRRLLDKSYL